MHNFVQRKGLFDDNEHTTFRLQPVLCTLNMLNYLFYCHSDIRVTFQLFDTKAA